LRNQKTTGQYQEAATYCKKVLRNDIARWDTFVTKFADLKHLEAIYQFVPTEPALSSSSYDRILYEFLDVDLAVSIEYLSLVAILNHSYHVASVGTNTKMACQCL
jgi:hypothetical protein